MFAVDLVQTSAGSHNMTYYFGFPIDQRWTASVLSNGNTLAAIDPYGQLPFWALLGLVIAKGTCARTGL